MLNNKLILSTIFLLLFILILVNVSKNTTLWLYKRDPLPKKLDVICTFGGDGSWQREKYSLELYQKYKPIWIVSTMDKMSFSIWAEKKNINMNDLIFAIGCQSTWDEIKMFNKKLRNVVHAKNNNEHAIVGFVSSHYHMRRIIVINSLINKLSNLKVLSLPVPIERNGFLLSNASEWWKYSRYRSIVLEEILKMVVDILSSFPIIGNWIRGWITTSTK